MKKVYSNPQTIVTKIELHQLMSISGTGDVNSVSFGGDYAGDASGVLGRGSNVWDDDEEDYY